MIERKRPRSHVVMEEAREFGMRHGFTVPIYGFNGFQACVTMGGPAADLPDNNYHALHVISLVAFSVARDMALERSVHRGSPELAPTDRETEVLKWASIGKSNWEIGQILKISEGTVEKHLAALARKMDVSNKAHAVAQGLRAGLIN